ncbi:hypothetical protein [Pedobacter zeae]|nr:hypothetical protein [Pedobacter zeae]MBB4110493.1 hypothetical protein [Pedobacter zeae]
MQNNALSKGILAGNNPQQELPQDPVKPGNKVTPKQTGPDDPIIKQVPKAKRQVKPMTVKPNVKIKPIKIIKPRIKRP